jgi:glutamate-1-semialdehyde 2,1-aminomutase
MAETNKVGTERQQRHSGSRALLDYASLAIPGGVNTARRRVDPPFCVRSGKGARIIDVDGRSYTDFHAAYGAVLLGHSFPDVDDRVAEVAHRGVLFGVGATEMEAELAHRLVRLVPSFERVLVCNTGSEATFHAVRLARACTNRPKIVKFQGCYHGYSDSVLRNNQSPAELVYKRDPGSAGILPSLVDDTLVCRFNDLDSVAQAFREHAGQIAAVITEPIPHNAPTLLPDEGFLEGLRRTCTEEGALLLFDEIVTGFRHHLGGFQAICNVSPDVTAVGKALGNGYPIAALGGAARYMDRFSTRDEGDVFFAGTYNGNAVGVGAALATLDVLEREPVHDHIFALGERMRTGLKRIADEGDWPVLVSGYGSIYNLSFQSGPLRTYEDVLRNDQAMQVRYRHELIERGVFEIPAPSGRNHLTWSHTTEDVDRSLEVAEEGLAAVFAGR